MLCVFVTQKGWLIYPPIRKGKCQMLPRINIQKQISVVHINAEKGQWPLQNHLKVTSDRLYGCCGGLNCLTYYTDHLKSCKSEKKTAERHKYSSFIKETLCVIPKELLLKCGTGADIAKLLGVGFVNSSHCQENVSVIFCGSC